MKTNKQFINEIYQKYDECQKEKKQRKQQEMKKFLNMAAVMVQSVADNQIINFQDHVIPGYLIKYCLRDFYMWSFVFHNQFGT